jgi:hypothetical protein
MNYNENSITGELYSYRRCLSVGIENPYKQIPKINFWEQDISILPNGKEIQELVGSTLSTTMENPITEFNLINPTDDSIIGTAKYQDIYVMLYSLYLKLAKERDLASQIQPVIETTTTEAPIIETTTTEPPVTTTTQDPLTDHNITDPSF